MAILPTTTGLTGKFTFCVNRFGDFFSVSYLRLADVGFYLEFTQHTVDDDIQVKLTHTRDNGLAGFFIGMCTEGRIFFCQFLECNTHFFLAGFCLRLDGNIDNRFREYHGFQNDRMIWIRQGVPGSGIFQAHGSDDVTGVNLGDFFTVVRMHLQDTAKTFSLTFCGITNIGACFCSTGVNTHKCQFTNIWVCHDFES